MSNKTSDENVENIEENIKTIKNLLQMLENGFLTEEMCPIRSWDPTPKYASALKYILAEREQDKARIKELEEERQLVGIPVRNKRDGKIGIVLHQWENGSIAVLERINPRIINTHDSWNTLEIITDEVKQVQTQDDTISKQVIIDKIKEVHNMKFEDDRLNGATIDFAVHKFEELLEGERK